MQKMTQQVILRKQRKLECIIMRFIFKNLVQIYKIQLIKLITI